jgi:hypothetical protein
MEVVLGNAVFFTIFGLSIANGCPTWGWLALLGAWAAGSLLGWALA